MDRDRSTATRLKCIPNPHGVSGLFENGMKRRLGEVHRGPKGAILNLGCGDFLLDEDMNVDGSPLYDLQPPEWVAPELRFDDETVGTIHAYHFLEHLNAADLKVMLTECSRVLKEHGVMNICVPYARSDIAFQDVDHKVFFTEESFETLLNNPYYDTFYGRKEPKLEVGANFIAGVVGRNMAVFTQLIKRGLNGE